MENYLQKGIAHIFVIVLILLGIVIVVVYGFLGTRQIKVGSAEDVLTILNKNCPSEEELIAAETFVNEFGPEDLKDDIEKKKSEPKCTFFQQVGEKIKPEEDLKVEKCIVPYAKPGPGDPFGEEICVPCYFVMNANTREKIENVCRDEIWKRDECFYWDVISYEADGLSSCYKTWGITEESELGDIPVGFEDQFDFGPYQDPDVAPPEPELEPLEPESLEPELEPLTP